MLSDHCSPDDQLGRTALIREIGDRILDADLPQVFGISGDWGSGKTSFLRQLQRYITGRCGLKPQWRPEVDQAHPRAKDVCVVWFEAWRYQNEELPVIPLLKEIRDQLPLAARALNESSKLFDVSVRSAFNTFDQAITGIRLSGLNSAQQYGERWESERFYTPTGTDALRKQLQFAIKQIIEGGHKRNRTIKLVVLVDDLDRCTPHAAYRLLEGIKIFLNLDNCAFVIAMNQDIVEQGISHLLTSASPSGSTAAKEYLEKICQNIWYLPVGKPPADFLRHSFDILLSQTAVSEKPLKAEFFDTVVKVASESNFLVPNARRIKSFANLLDRFSYSYVRVEDEGPRIRNVKIAIVFAYLYQSFQPVYRILQAEPDFYNKQFLVWAKNPPLRKDESSEFPFTHPVLKTLLPTVGNTEDVGKSPTPGSDALESLYPDPVREGYVRIQKLVIELDALDDEEQKQYSR